MIKALYIYLYLFNYTAGIKSLNAFKQINIISTHSISTLASGPNVK